MGRAVSQSTAGAVQDLGLELSQHWTLWSRVAGRDREGVGGRREGLRCASRQSGHESVVVCQSVSASGVDSGQREEGDVGHLPVLPHVDLDDRVGGGRSDDDATGAADAAARQQARAPPLYGGEVDARAQRVGPGLGAQGLGLAGLHVEVVVVAI